MVQRLACEATNIFAAYAVAVANMRWTIPNLPSGAACADRVFRRHRRPADAVGWRRGPARPVPRRRRRVLSVPQTMGFWSRADGCSAARMVDLPNRVADGTQVRQHDFGGCGLVLYEIQGAGHTWPGGQGGGGFFAQRIVGNTTRAIDATVVMLGFFSALWL